MTKQIAYFYSYYNKFNIISIDFLCKWFLILIYGMKYFERYVNNSWCFKFNKSEKEYPYI